MNELLWDVWVDICNCVCNVLYCSLICIFVFQGQIKPLYGNKTPLKLRMCWVFICTNPQHASEPAIVGWPPLMRQSADGWRVHASAWGLTDSWLLEVMSESAQTVLVLRLFYCGIVWITVAFHNGECLPLAETLLSFFGWEPWWYGLYAM